MEDGIKKIFNELNIEIFKIERFFTFADYVFKVHTKKSGYFIKIYEKKENEYLAKKLFNLYEKLASADVPVPQVIKYDESKELIDNVYIVLSEAEGYLLKDKMPFMDHKDKIDFYYDFGKLLAKIHSFKFDMFGDTFDGEKVFSYIEANGKGPFKSWKDMHKQIIDYRLEFLKGSDFDDLIKPLKDYFNRNSYLIDYDITPRLLHIDLNQKNVFINDNKVSCIIDFDGAFVGHNEEELMRTQVANFNDDKELKKSFLKGYTKVIKLDDGYEDRLDFYYLSRFLVHLDCIVEFAEYRREHNDIQALKNEVYERINRSF